MQEAYGPYEILMLSKIIEWDDSLLVMPYCIGNI